MYSPMASVTRIAVAPPKSPVRKVDKTRDMGRAGCVGGAETTRTVGGC